MYLPKMMVKRVGFTVSEHAIISGTLSTSLFKRNKLSLFFLVFLCLANSSKTLADENSVEQDFLFITEEAFTQEAGEFQFGVGFESFSASLNELSANSKQKQLSLEIEYGLTDDWQISIEQSFEDFEFSSANFRLDEEESGPVELGLKYQIHRTDKASFSAAIEIESPEESGEDWQYGFGLFYSRNLSEDWFVHLQHGCEREDGELECESGVAFARHVSDQWTLNAEISHSETESVEFIDNQPNDLIINLSENLTVYSLGAYYTAPQDWMLGIAVTHGSESFFYDNGVVLKFQVEFD